MKPTIHAFGSKSLFVSVLVVSADVGSKVTVYRQYAGNPVEIVRGADSFAVTHVEQLFIDYEVPQDEVITYWVSATAGSVTVESVRVTSGPYNFGGDVVFDLADPKRGMKIFVESFQQSTFGISRDVQRVWGRPDPVVISGVREMLSGQLVLLTLEPSEQKNFLNIINNGSLIAFAPWKNDYGLPGVSYYAVGNVTESRVVTLANQSARRWTLEVQQVSPPPATYKFPDYGLSWRELRESTWRTESSKQWWEAIA